MRTIFESLARANERVHIQNVRDFPQTKLDREMNSPFLDLLNEHSDPWIFLKLGGVVATYISCKIPYFCENLSQLI